MCAAKERWTITGREASLGLFWPNRVHFELLRAGRSSDARAHSPRSQQVRRSDGIVRDIEIVASGLNIAGVLVYSKGIHLQRSTVLGKSRSHEIAAVMAIVGIVALSAVIGVSASYAMGRHQYCNVTTVITSLPTSTFTRTVNAHTVTTVTNSSFTFTRTAYPVTNTTFTFTRTRYPVTNTTLTFTRTVYCLSVTTTSTVTRTVHPFTITKVTATTFTFTRVRYPVITTSVASPTHTRRFFTVITTTASSPTFTRRFFTVITTTVTSTASTGFAYSSTFTMTRTRR